jgi:predicted nucleic acid-binding protein
MKREICIDTSFFIGLYQERHNFNSRARQLFGELFEKSGHRMVILWPIVYETFSSKSVGNRNALENLKADWARLRQKDQLRFMSDLPFRDRVIDECFDQLLLPVNGYRALSAADRVIRKVMADRNLRISGLISFNPKDFQDVCKRFRRDLFQ